MGDHQEQSGCAGPKVYCVTGVAGAGKTTEAVRIVEEKIRSGLRWDQIAFCSFSRAASSEAAGRVAELTGESLTRLQQVGWYRTLHSAALKCLGIDKKLILDNDSKSGKEFFQMVFGTVPGGEPGTFSDQVTKALDEWNYFRATLGRSPGSDNSDVNSPYECTDPKIKCDNEGGHTDLCVSRHDENPVFYAGFLGHTPEGCVSQSVPSVPNEAVATEQPTTHLNGDTGHTRHTGTHSGHTKSVCVGQVSSMPALICANPDSLIAYRDSNPSSGRWSAVFNTHMSTTNDQSGNPFTSDQRSKSRPYGRVLTGQLKSGTVQELISKYESAKILHGKLDFTDILMRFTGITTNDDFTFRQSTPSGTIPEELEVVIVDEYQDCSRLLDAVAVRLSETAGELHLLGDPYQAIYGFSGSCATLMLHREDQAIRDGRRTLLNCTRRNPPEVLKWGEAVLEQDGWYRSRMPTSDTESGTVGLMEWGEFLMSLPLLVGRDVMILGRSWWNLAAVKKRLDDLGVPWSSCSELQNSRWDCPAKIAYTLVMRELGAGERISEQDFRRATTELNQKVDGKELFVRGTKTKWAKLECRRDPERTIDDLTDWGTTQYFTDWVRAGGWKRDMPLLLDQAITKYGIHQVRRPSIRIGTVHSVKGLEARLVFCLAASTENCLTANWNEELALKYVAITRTSRHYRLVVDSLDVARSRPMFWAAPENERLFLKGIPDEDAGWSREKEGIDDSGQVSHLGEVEADEWEVLRREGARRNLCGERHDGHDSLRRGAVPGDRVQGAGGGTDANSGVQDEAGQEEWWDL